MDKNIDLIGEGKHWFEQNSQKTTIITGTKKEEKNRIVMQ